MSLVRSLGVLTLDLVAKVGGFIGPMDKASRESQRRAKEIERSMKKASDAIKTVIGALAAGAVFSKITQETVNFQNEQAQLAAVLRSTGEAAGYSRDQLNDMATEMSRTSIISEGEINQAQTTLLAFTGIVGDEFPRALQVAIDMASRTGMSVVSASETIGRALDIPSKGLTSLSKQGFRFTEDQKKLAEYLESTGRTAEAQGLILEALEESYGGAAKAARDTLGGALAALGNQFDSLMTGESGLEETTAAINDLTDALADPRVKEAFNTVISGVIGITTTVAKALPELVAFTTWAAEELAAIRVGIAADDIVRMEQEADKIRDILDGGFAAFGERIRFFGPDGIVKLWTTSELERELALLGAGIESFYKAQEKPAVSTPPAGVAPAVLDESSLLEEAKRAAEAEKARKLAADAAAAAVKAAAAAEKQRLESIASQITQLEFQAETYGYTAAQIGLYKLETMGATEAQLLAAAAAYDVIDALDAEKKASEEAQKQKEAALKAINDLLPEQEQKTRQLLEQQKFLNEALLDYPELSKDIALALSAVADEIEKVGKKTGEMSVFAEQAARNIQNSFADFLFDPFDEGLEGLADNFLKTLQRMAADAAAAAIFDSLGFGGTGSSSGGSSGGGVNWASIAGWFGGFFAEGGRPAANKISIVGERGPELFIPDGITGAIIANDKIDMAAMREDRVRTTQVHIGNMNFPGVTNARQAEQSAGAAGRRINAAIAAAQRFS